MIWNKLVSMSKNVAIVLSIQIDGCLVLSDIIVSVNYFISNNTTF